MWKLLNILLFLVCLKQGLAGDNGDKTYKTTRCRCGQMLLNGTRYMDEYDYYFRGCREDFTCETETDGMRGKVDNENCVKQYKKNWEGQMYLQFFCAKPRTDWRGSICHKDNATWQGTSMDLYCCKGEMCNDVTTHDDDYKQKVLHSCQNMNVKRKDDSRELIDCLLIERDLTFINMFSEPSTQTEMLENFKEAQTEIFRDFKEAQIKLFSDFKGAETELFRNLNQTEMFRNFKEARTEMFRIIKEHKLESLETLKEHNFDYVQQDHQKLKAAKQHKQKEEDAATQYKN